MAKAQWIRGYRLHIYVPDKQVSSGALNKSRTRFYDREILITDLRCTFSCKKTMLRDSSIGEITLWNLSPYLESLIISEGHSLVLEAGYVNSSITVIFSGRILQPIRGKKSGTDYYLKLVCLDGDSYFNLAFSSGTLASNQTKSQLAKQTLRLSNYNEFQGGRVKVEDLDDLPNESTVDGSIVKNERPKVVFGRTSKIIDNLARMGNSSAYIENGQLKFFKANEDSTKHRVWEINPSTGMIGDPTQSEYQISVRVLLNPLLKIQEFIHLQNSTIRVQQYGIREIPFLLEPSGLYQIIEIGYSGDTHGQEWYCDIKAITRNGKVPSQLSDKWGNLIV